MTRECVLELKHISKDYGTQRVLNDINFSVGAGEIHALLGENGAGKSTLMNILFGMPVIHSTGGYQGDIIFCGETHEIKTTMDSIHLGIGMVHQEFMLLPYFTVAENIKLNREPTRPNAISRILKNKGRFFETIDQNKMESDAREDLNRLDVKTLRETTLVKELSVGHMQFVEIAREIDKERMRLLIFDEPTAVLTEEESAIFLRAVRKIAETGIAIIFISHKLEEVLQISDNITVLKDGEQVCTVAAKDTNILHLAELMVGRKFERIAPDHSLQSQDKQQETAMELRDFWVDMPGESVCGLNLKIFKGEILGLASLAGHGKIGLANGIMGLAHARGDVTLFGEPYVLNHPTKALKSGLSFVSEDRKGTGLLLDQSIEMNLIVTEMQIRNRYLKKVLFLNQIDRKLISENAKHIIKELDIRCQGPNQEVRRLSGGNQQKVCLGRALAMEPKVLFVSEPTRGIDIGAKKMILDHLVELNRKTGLTIVITSSELAELRSISDRIAIIFRGRLEGILEPNDSDIKYGLYMSGSSESLKSGIGEDERKVASCTDGKI
jgi:simple sugar transport system ATP-binding protein